MGLALLVVVPHIRSIPVDLLFLLAAWFCLWFFSHDLAHHVIGRIVGVGFRYYFLGRSSITKLNLPIVSNVLRMFPVLGLKIDKSSLKSVSEQGTRDVRFRGHLLHVSTMARDPYRILNWSSSRNLAHNTDNSKHCLYSLLQPASRRPSPCSNGQKIGRIAYHDTF